MNQENEKKFNPKRLREARLVRGYSISELASQVGVSRQAISQFELGESAPKIETMMGLINVLRFPRGFFYKDYKTPIVGNTFFRATTTATKKTKESQLYKTILAGYLYDYLDQYVEFPQLNLPIVPEDKEWTENNIELLALTVREFWGIGLHPIKNIINLLEQNGIIVISLETDNEKVDAFCQHRAGRPFIFLGNDKESAFRRQFDGAHELGHILMHRHIDNQDLLTREEYKLMEQQANKFASAFLLPKESFTNSISSTSLLHFVELKKYWHVSMGAMIYRCKDLGIIDEAKYTSLQKQMSMKKMKKKEPLDDVYPLPMPVVFKKSIMALLNSNLKSGPQIVQEIAMPQKYIEMFCNLKAGTLNSRVSEPKIRLIKKEH